MWLEKPDDKGPIDFNIGAPYATRQAIWKHHTGAEWFFDLSLTYQDPPSYIRWTIYDHEAKEIARGTFKGSRRHTEDQWFSILQDPLPFMTLQLLGA